MNIDDLGLGAIGKIFRFVKNIRNFRELSLFKKITTVGVPLGTASAFVIGGLALKAQNKSVSEMLAMSPAQQVMMESCVQNHTDIGYEFGEDTPLSLGCGCSAKLISSVTPPAHYAAFADVHRLYLDQYSWEFDEETEAEQQAAYDAKLNAAIGELTDVVGVNRKGVKHIHDYMASAETVCNMRESYKGDALISLTELKPLDTPIWEGDSDGVIQISLRGADAPITVSMK